MICKLIRQIFLVYHKTTVTRLWQRAKS